MGGYVKQLLIGMLTSVLDVSWVIHLYNYVQRLDLQTSLGTAEGGAGRATTFFTWVNFLGLQMSWIMHEFYHLKVTKHICFCICASRSQRSSKAAQQQLFSHAFLPYGRHG